MANFNEAYLKTLNFEGGYSNDSDDVGGETYKGIARNYHGNWSGWSVIDSLKGSEIFEKDMKDNTELQNLVKYFYKENFWDVNLLDKFVSQDIANEIFDSGVNLGVSRAAKFIQRALSYLNKNESLFADLVDDGKIGKLTLDALDIIMERGEEKLLYKILNILQANHYLEYMTKSPTQEKFARGWFSRVDFIK